jgi:hypothetical protein
MVTKMRNVLFTLLLTLGFFACNDNCPTVIIPSNSYFPLEIGNTWTYAPPNYDGFNGKLTTTIKDKTIIDGKECYIMQKAYTNNTGTFYDTIYYRMDEKGYVYSKFLDNQEVNVFRLFAKDKEEWSVPFMQEGEIGKITSTSDVVVKLGVDSLTHCKTFSFDVAAWADEEWWATLAPGIGIVSEGGAWSQYKLKSAVVGGRTYNF